MSISRRAIVPLTSLALSLTLTVAPAFTQSSRLPAPADKVLWGPHPPVLPAGAQSSVLEPGGFDLERPSNIFYINPANDPQNQ
jgi:hypothetical protein